MNSYANLVTLDAERGVCTIEGVDYPAVGFGTYPLQNTVCTTAVEQAVLRGYHIIDTATFYENLESIAQALKSYDRSNVYCQQGINHFVQNQLHDVLSFSITYRPSS